MNIWKADKRNTFGMGPEAEFVARMNDPTARARFRYLCVSTVLINIH